MTACNDALKGGALGKLAECKIWLPRSRRRIGIILAEFG
jgi:hypothetical protein